MTDEPQARMRELEAMTRGRDQALDLANRRHGEAIKAVEQRDQAIQMSIGIARQNRLLRALVAEMLDNLKHCSLDSGCCHCGDRMDTHPAPMTCGHTPVDMGWTAAQGWIDKVNEFERGDHMKEREG